MTASPYRTLFTGVLVQQSALSVGGSDAGASHLSVDNPLSRDGLGRPTLAGSALAGALIATARKLYAELPAAISAGLPASGDARPPDSCWRVFTAHPEPNGPAPERRPGVGIRQATGAAATGALYDTEALPRGTRWPFCLEVDDRALGSRARAVAAAALLEWSRGRCWIGRYTARGLGWLVLEDLEARILEPRHAALWPDSLRGPAETLADLPPAVSAADPAFASRLGLEGWRPDAPWHYLELHGQIRVGLADGGYGLDALSVGSHGGHPYLARAGAEPRLGPLGQDPSAALDTLPNHLIARTRAPDGTWEPFIPGSGLRGPLRHALSRRLRGRGERIADPNGPLPDDPPPAQDPAADLFGHLEHSARLLVRDAYLTPGADWCAVRRELHAEDELRGGVFGSAKLDREVLIRGLFDWRMVLEGRTPGALAAWWRLLAPALRAALAGHLPLGGGKWRGAGWCRWTLEPARLHRGGETEPTTYWSLEEPGHDD